MNKLGEDHKWVIDANKDGADVDAAIVMGGRREFCVLAKTALLLLVLVFMATE
jgi:hypothetical protein